MFKAIMIWLSFHSSFGLHQSVRETFGSLATKCFIILQAGVWLYFLLFVNGEFHFALKMSDGDATVRINQN